MSTLKIKNILVKEVMLKIEDFPVLFEKVLFKDTLETMNRFRLGIACIVNSQRQLIGIITDGDIRRKLLKVQKPFSALFVDDALIHSIRNPITIQPITTLIEAIELMGKNQIWDLPVVDDLGTLVGLLHLHPAIQVVLGVK
ncbi:MAG: CBS domain-containing protein [Desulfobacterales bacterium]|nr:CBS domain-containing protein [Desulfobacterales bacterium]